MSFLQAARDNFEFEIFLLAARIQLDGNFFWQDPPAGRGVQAQAALGRSGQVRTNAYLDCPFGTVRERDHLLAGFQFNRKCRRNCQGTLLFHTFLVRKSYQHRRRDFGQGMRLDAGVISSASSEFGHIKVHDDAEWRRRERHRLIFRLVYAIDGVPLGIVSVQSGSRRDSRLR